MFAAVYALGSRGAMINGEGPVQTRVIAGNDEESPSSPPQAEVPHLVGLDISEATRVLERLELQGAKSAEVHDSEPEGTVVQQDPPSGEHLTPGSEVTLTISLGPDLLALGESIETLFRDVERVLVYHERSNRPWEKWKSIHGAGSSSWIRYVRENHAELIASDQALAEDYRRLSEEARTMATPLAAPASFTNMLDILAEGCEAGAERCERSVDLIRKNLDGGSPSWGPETSYGRARARHKTLLGPTGSIGGEALEHYKSAFRPDLQLLREQQ